MDLSDKIREKGLKVTHARLRVLQALGSGRRAFAHAELEGLFATMDRVTLYRVLHDFEQAGLVHRVPDAAGITRYAFSGNYGGDKMKIEHPHFTCNSCQKVYCLDEIRIPDFQLPKGFTRMITQTLLYGLCGDCNGLKMMTQ